MIVDHMTPFNSRWSVAEDCVRTKQKWTKNKNCTRLTKPTGDTLLVS